MANRAAQKRLTKEYISMQKGPPPFVWAVPEEKNILTWHFLIRGPPDSPFANGEYHGVLLFPSEYPFKPPGIKMLTPSGRFQPDKKICFSMSDFHPGTWNPAWSVATILTGLLSFMLSDEMTTGSIISSDDHKKFFAAKSHAFNLTQPWFRDAFPDFCTPTLKDLPNMGERSHGKTDLASAVNTSVTNPYPSPIPSPASATLPDQPILRRSTGMVQTLMMNTPPVGDDASNSFISTNKAIVQQGWTASLCRIILERWRWGLLIAIAVIVSSRAANS